MKTRAILMDMDGVMTDFIFGFTSKMGDLRTWTGDEFPFESLEAPEFHQQTVNHVWEYIEHSSDFWAKLPPTVAAIRAQKEIVNLCENFEVYFVTSRKNGQHIHRQTISWLWDFGIHNPLVILSHQKARVAKAVNAIAGIDDHPNIVRSYEEVRPTGMWMLMDQRWNRNKLVTERTRSLTTFCMKAAQAMAKFEPNDHNA